MPERRPRPPRAELLRPSKPLTALAEEYGVTYGTIHRWRRAAGAKCMSKGENHWNAKLTRADADLIRELSAAGVMQKDIAAKMEVSQATVSTIINYGSWY